MGIFTTALGNKKIGQILTKNTSSYFHSALPVNLTAYYVEENPF